jgi:hypothetical protein
VQFQLTPKAILTRAVKATRKPESIRIRHQNGRGRSTRKIVFLLLYWLFAICSFAHVRRAEEPDAATAKVEGIVFVQDSAGNRSGLAGAKVELNGPVAFETETDKNGSYVIAGVPPGTYTLEADSPGLEARQTVHIEAGEVQVPLELKPSEVTTLWS